MADTAYGLNDAETVKLWSKRLAREALKQTYAQKFMGTDNSSLIQIKADTQKSAGDRVRLTLRMQLAGDGVVGDSTLEGNEEELSTYTDDIVINQLRHAVRSAGKMSEQRIPWSVREEAMSGLKDWWSDRIDATFFNHICGYTVQTDARYAGNNAIVAPSSTRILRAGALSTDQAVQADSTKVFTLDLIDKAVEKAKVATPLIRPIMIGGEPHYVMFLHPYQVTSLRTNTSTGQYVDIQKAAMSGGNASKNPLFTGALGMYNNVILHEATRVTQGVHSTSGAAQTSVRRAVLCGAQAVGMGFGKEFGPGQFDWNEELFDYKNKLGVEAGCIFGMKKTVYNSVDFGTVVVSTYAAAAS